MTARNIRISLEEVREHLDHSLKVDYGLSGFGQGRQMEYTMFCVTCNKTIGSTVRSAVN